jgi:hypothetical protein
VGYLFLQRQIPPKIHEKPQFSKRVRIKIKLIEALAACYSTQNTRLPLRFSWISAANSGKFYENHTQR